MWDRNNQYVGREYSECWIFSMWEEDILYGGREDSLSDLSLAYFSKRTLNLNGLEYHFRGLFVQNLTKSDFFRPIFVQNLTFMRKLPYFAKCDKTA